MKKNWLIILYIIHTLIKFNLAENVLNSTMLKQYVYVNRPPKEWFKYIAKYLQIEVYKRQQNLIDKYRSLKCTKLTSGKTLKWSMENTILYPLGFIKKTRELCIKSSFNSAIVFEKPVIRILFFLDRKLQLNLTFHHIHFGFRNLHDCTVGQVKVISHSSVKQVFRYCGIHSNFDQLSTK